MGQIRTAPFKQPGSYGVNTNDEIANDQAYRFATRAMNGVIDSNGKLVARKDFNIVTTSGGSGTFEQIYVHRKNDGTEEVYSVCAGKVYTGTTTLTARVDWSATSSTLNSPQFAALTSKVYIFQAGIAPYVLNESSYAAESFTGAPWSGSPNCVIAAYGRLWVADNAAGNNRYTVWWSNLLDGKVWNTGDAGSLNVQSAWPAGQDTIVALAAAFGRLIIFGRNTILMYTLPTDNDPATMSLTDVISHTGCVARDSVVVTDDGVYFLSANGIKRINKFAQVTSLIELPPVSQLINRDVIDTYAGETMTKVRAGYYPKEGWYVINAPTANLCFVANTRQKLPQMEYPAFTTWNNTSMPFRAFAYDKDGNWYCAGTNGVFKYNTYVPDAAASNYNFEFYTQWLDFGDESRLKHLKYSELVLKAAAGQTGTFRWQVDYDEDDTSTAPFTCSPVEFVEDPGLGNVKVHIGRSCNVARFGFSIPINGDEVQLHAMKVAATTGKASAAVR